MVRLRHLLALSLLFSVVAMPSVAGAGETVFVNLTSSEPERATMGVGFAYALLKDGHTVTIFLNLDGGPLGSTKSAGLAEQRKTLESFIKEGGTVLICPHCMELRHIPESDLVKGIAMSNNGAARKAFLAASKSISY